MSERGLRQLPGLGVRERVEAVTRLMYVRERVEAVTRLVCQREG